MGKSFKDRRSRGDKWDSRGNGNKKNKKRLNNFDTSKPTKWDKYEDEDYSNGY